MAEVFGLAANGIGIAAFCVQIVGQVSEIKAFIASLKNAPQELNDLVEEIALLNELLLQISGSLDLTDLNVRCTQACMKAATLMQEILQECQTKMEKRKFRGRLHFVMRGDIDKSLGRLERAKGLLSLAHLALLSHQTLSAKQVLVENPLAHEKWVDSVTSEQPHRSRDPILRVALPMWLSGKVWEFYSFSAQNQWAIGLKKYVVLPEDSPIFRHVRQRNLDAFRDLIRETPSLIFSQTPDGQPHRKTLVFMPDPEPEERRKIGNLLLQSSQDRLIGNEFNDGYDLLPYFSPDADFQQQILKAAYPPIHEQSESLRVRLCGDFLFASVFRYEPFDPDSTVFSILGSIDVKQWKDSLPYILAACVVMDLLTKCNNTSTQGKVHQLLSEAVNHGADFAIQRSVKGQILTPMLEFLSRYWETLDWVKDDRWYNRRFLSERAAPLNLRDWAHVLSIAGVDLMAYGKQEKSLHIQGQLDRWICRRFTGEEAVYVRLIGFTYGPRPEDWHAYFSNWRDEFTGDFWYMVENPELVQIPGSWALERYPWATDDDSY
ncbi:hypothetical protein FE257_000331 [Aspergillus nanangensis]|uniref:NACHT-NTPase and P-loop NTPases N-terminal domain-containing protein n=1 Tax=Aspergillus nanangensis TaxID=2582783 RepID=A0AAD4CZ71_ASPNN|nr:hypothetical protein FE257_000331 [Aspergillus nanangensis]